MKKTLCSTFAVLVAALISMPASAALIVNGSFEANTGIAPTGWTYTNPTFGVFNWQSQWGFPAQQGSNAFWLGATDTNGNDVLSQTMTGFTPGNSYTLSFFMQRENGSDQGRPGAFMVMNLTGSSITTAQFSDVATGSSQFTTPFVQKSLTFVATASNVNISMHGDIVGHQSWEIGLDNFQIQDNGAANVPEPATLAIWGGLSLVGLVAARRRKQTA